MGTLNSSGKIITLLRGEPCFVIRAKDDTSIYAIQTLAEIYDLPISVLRGFIEWRNEHPTNCKEPD